MGILQGLQANGSGGGRAAGSTLGATRRIECSDAPCSIPENCWTLFHSAGHGGALEDATHYGQAGTPGQGPCIRIWLRDTDDRVSEARWKAWGCPAGIACSEAVCRWAEGRLLEDLLQVASGEVADWVGSVPEGKEHCPELAAQALRSVTQR